MTDDQKQNMKEYQKKYREVKKINNKNKQNVSCYYKSIHCNDNIIIIFDGL